MYQHLTPLNMLAYAASLLLCQFALVEAYKLREDARFSQYSPQFSDNLENALHRDCMGNYTIYVTAPLNRTHPQDWASNLVACLLESSAITEAIKANMASAQVLLGFLPTFLTLVGCTPSQTSLLGLRRPLLAVLLTIGSPAPSWTQGFEYPDYEKMLQDDVHHAHFQTRAWQIDGAKRRRRNTLLPNFILMAEFILVLAAAGNTVELAFRLGYLTASSFAPSTSWLVILWTIMGVLVHIFATIALRLRMKVMKGGHGDKSRWNKKKLMGIVQDEFTLCAMHDKTKLVLKGRDSPWTVLVFWIAATGTAAIVVYGTVVFSSTLFISTSDATVVVVRYMLSALLCRAILMYELDGMRRVNTEESSTVERPGLGRSATEMRLLSPNGSSAQVTYTSPVK